MEDEIKGLMEKNAELVKEMQFWKITAGQKEKEKLELMKELNELRLKLSRLRSGGAAEVRKLDAALQPASEAALSHLVQASGAVAKMLELTKQYMQDRQDLDNSSPRWSALGGTPNMEKVHRCPPLLIGGQSIQPVVSLSRTMLNLSARSATRSPILNSSLIDRAVPMHMLQDVYIPLQRIDLSDLQGNSTRSDAEDMDSADDLGLDEGEEQVLEESTNATGVNEVEDTRMLEAVAEEPEPADTMDTLPRSTMDNPLEGPSWLLDAPGDGSGTRTTMNLEPDSTTPCEERAGSPSAPAPESPRLRQADDARAESPTLRALVFTPTVRRRKRTASPPPPPRRPSITSKGSESRVLKVVVAKMRLSDEAPGAAGEPSPPKRVLLASPKMAAPNESPPRRPMRFDAPSPNGATDSGVIVLEASRSDAGGGDTANVTQRRQVSRGISRGSSRSVSRGSSRSASPAENSDSSVEVMPKSRSRRVRNNVTYKEKPLNRKLRR